ncbi:MAG: hypothetical protein GX871_09085 [Microbacteriaceae bacterium]|nr:hypothetical protein [Microbacteriaceae bacterium]
MTSTNPYAHPPFSCVLCEREIPARAWHTILTPLSALPPVSSPEEREAAAGAIVCGKCRDLPDAHSRLFPECAAAGYCDLYDHGHTLAANRAAAVVWLTQHGRLNPETPITTTKGIRP